MRKRSDERQRVVDALLTDGVSGVNDFGRFVNNTAYFPASSFDVIAAIPTLARILPELQDQRVIETVARYLGRKEARGVAFEPLIAAFCREAATNPLTGWAIGDALATVAETPVAPALIDLCDSPEYGRARQKIVYSMWRHKKHPDVVPLLKRLLLDPDVAGHACTALRRSIGNPKTLHLVEAALQATEDVKLRAMLVREKRKLDKKLGQGR